MQLELPSDPVTLSPEQVKEFNQKLSKMRHDINNALTVIIASTELLRNKPETPTRYVDALSQQPSRIIESMKLFSSEFEQTLRIRRL